MGRHGIPLSVKITVIRQYLEGLPRDQIAQNNSISTGSVSNIVYDCEEDIPDIYLLREVAVKLKKENIEIKEFASSIRLKNILNSLEMTEEKIESVLEGVSEFCFKRARDNKFFINEMGKVIEFMQEMYTPIDQVQHLLVNKNIKLNILKEEINETRGRINEMKKEIDNLYLEYNVTKADLQKFRENRPLILQVEYMTNELDKAEEKIRSQNKLIGEYEQKLNINTKDNNH